MTYPINPKDQVKSDPKPTEADHPTNCPLCNASLLGDPIPEEDRQYYAGNYWKLEMGMEYHEKYDGVWEYKCPSCEGTWPSVVGRLK